MSALLWENLFLTENKDAGTHCIRRIGLDESDFV